MCLLVPYHPLCSDALAFFFFRVPCLTHFLSLAMAPRCCRARSFSIASCLALLETPLFLSLQRVHLGFGSQRPPLPPPAPADLLLFRQRLLHERRERKTPAAPRRFCRAGCRRRGEGSRAEASAIGMPQCGVCVCVPPAAHLPTRLLFVRLRAVSYLASAAAQPHSKLHHGKVARDQQMPVQRQRGGAGQHRCLFPIIIAFLSSLLMGPSAVTVRAELGVCVGRRALGALHLALFSAAPRMRLNRTHKKNAANAEGEAACK